MDKNSIGKKQKGGSNPNGFDRIVREVYAPIYPITAKQIRLKTNTNKGKCLDVGCGTGALGRAMAKITDMHIIFFDQSEEMLSLSKKYAKEEKIINKCSFLQGDIHDTGIKDDSLNIVISRGSCFFWKDKLKAFNEILRILKKGGHAYIGGGFGTKKLKKQIFNEMNKRDPKWKKSVEDRMKTERENLPKILNALSLASYTIIDDESGLWAFITK